MSETILAPTLTELCIVACSEAFRTADEIVATGVGPVPRLAAGLAKLTHSPGLMMTDGEAYLVEQPVPIGPRSYDDRKPAGYLPFSRFFDSAVWTGRAHSDGTFTVTATDNTLTEGLGTIVIERGGKMKGL